jgi:hypothetical protein
LKRLALYPFLFVLYVISVPLANNLDQLDVTLALRPLALLSLGAAAGFLLFYLLFRDWHYAGFLVFLLALVLFGFGYLNRFVQEQLTRYSKTLDERILLGICAGLLLIIALKGVWARLGGRTSLPAFLNLVMAIGLLFTAARIVSYSIREPFRIGRASAGIQAGPDGVVLNCASTPDIYYIILDGYGRADVLSELFELDNTPFLEYLERKGFYIANQSHTNYTQTIFSIPSSLNFRYIEPPIKVTNDQQYFSELMRNNDIMAALKRCGYRTIALESGFFFTDHPEVDVYLTSGSGLNEFESLLWADSPIEMAAQGLDLQPSEYSFEAHRRRVLFSFEKLKTIYRMPGQKFVFAHIISPHPPFVFDWSGKPIEPGQGYFIGDGDDFPGSLDEYLSGYPEQVRFVNHKLEQAIDSILENSTKSPIIIIQGDHGPGSRLDWHSPARTCLWERTPILNAYFLPGDAGRLLYPSISPVNSFRVVLNAYFGADLPLLSDATYFTSHRLEDQAIDVTMRRSSRAQCNLPK